MSNYRSFRKRTRSSLLADQDNRMRRQTSGLASVTLTDVGGEVLLI